MCEWLSHGEWCDVKLVCGGRAFSAHRAVLASVSIFLRRILLSCPTDEMPTLIILPDFDLDAMSSILYYIYNGEVFLQKEKLEVFLDIINAMEIHIDSKYLPKKPDTTDFIISNASVQYENKFIKRNIFTLGLKDTKDQQYINLKKGKEIQEVLSQYILGNSDWTDKAIRCENSSGERKSSLGDLESPFGDRQRSSFLRDLFIETYPRNGNVNGLPAGVLAISNEYYRAPASVLLKNANGKHLGADDTLSETYKKTARHISHSPTVVHPHKQQCLRDQHDYGETSNGLYAPSYLNVCPADTKTFYESNEIKTRFNKEWMNHDIRLPDQLHEQKYQPRLPEHILSGYHFPSLDLVVSPPMFKTVKSPQRCRNNKPSSPENKETYKDVDTSGASKAAILNQVLDSPWSPRTPMNYTPFRRKLDSLKQSQLPHKSELKCNSGAIRNDSNNNVSNVETKVPETILRNENKDPTDIHTNKKDDFKCTICNQVFTNNESLSVHSRRHNSSARYTCGECGKTFSQLRNFKYHMSIHRGTREFAATCTVCGKYFNDRGYLSSHMKIHRNRKEYKCTICPKSFNQRVAYNMHVRIHTGVKPHVCEECGKAFSRKMLLKQHQRTHSGERPYACPHCDKRFADRSNMTLHLRLHTGVKPFSCSLCPKSFTKKHHLKSHLNFHTGSKPYSCPRCKLAFTQSSNMRTHLKKCNAPEPSSEGESNQITQ